MWFSKISHALPKGAPGLVMGSCIVEMYRIVIIEVQYQLEVNRCRNEDIIVKGNFGWVWSMWVGRPKIDRIEYIVARTDGRTDGEENHNITTLFKKRVDYKSVQWQ
ncbi:hypothetical protein DPMN_004473 [Dreissena polymorpha]|uniref:Uncharacterized protein n=1 Tax=Dreissena polymorpha TaxID=45954 RepID=A0A9D4MRS9_DREPO|nr:hypothetical protein DPMN_004473 [Dreissena polymorpha]